VELGVTSHVEILKLKRLGQSLIQVVKDRAARLDLVNRAECVEIPVVVVPLLTGLAGMPLGSLALHAFVLGRRLVVNTGSCRQKNSYRRCLLGGRKRLAYVIDAKLGERSVEMNLSFIVCDTEQQTRDALAHRMHAGRQVHRLRRRLSTCLQVGEAVTNGPNNLPAPDNGKRKSGNLSTPHFLPD
jgi:hypothetical protein